MTRDKASAKSPKKFNPLFYAKDNWQRIIMSLLLSVLLAVLFYLVSPEVFKIDAELDRWGVLAYVAIGAAPDLVIGYAKRKTSFLKPDKIVIKEETFTRK
jgi:archaellum biogenesis protein FlaJ (TadC family)